MTRRDALRLIGAGAAPLGLIGRDAFGHPKPTAQIAGFVPDVELTLTASPGEARILPGKPTAVWKFSGAVTKGPAETLETLPDSYLGPTLRFRRGQRVRIRFINGLPEPSIVHWHGLDVPEKADGHPHLAIGPNREYIYEFQVTNQAGTYWYHPHPHERTGVQVYRGLAGMLVVSDDEERALGLPDGAQDVLCVLQDRRFDAENQLAYLSGGMMDQMHGLLGDRILVNGRIAPVVNVASRGYRLRLLNGSSSRVYKLAWSDGTPLTIIGNGASLLDRPRAQRYLTLAPAQRADVFVDFSGRAVGTSVELRTAAYPASDVDQTAGGMGMMGGAANASANGAAVSLMTLRVDRQEVSSYKLPQRLAAYGPMWALKTGAPIRRVPISFAAGQWLLDGRAFDMMGTAPEEDVRAGSTQIWEITNVSGMMGMPMAHPMHVHGLPFRVLSREPVSGTAGSSSIREGLLDEGWMDTVLILPNERIRLQVTFTQYPGLYLYHCHILEHEDMGLMRNFRVLPR